MNDEQFLCNLAQLLDAVKLDWGAEWSEWDQQQRDEITRRLIEFQTPAVQAVS